MKPDDEHDAAPLLSFSLPYLFVSFLCRFALDSILRLPRPPLLGGLVCRQVCSLTLFLLACWLARSSMNRSLVCPSHVTGVRACFFIN
jgi:hypothetical protein